MEEGQGNTTVKEPIPVGTPVSAQPIVPPSQDVTNAPVVPDSPRPAFSGRNLIKFLIGLFAVVFVLFILFAFVFPNINKTPEKTQITFWGLFEDAQVFQPVISQFEKENPNVTVSYEKEDLKDYKEKLKTRINQGNGPDIFRFHNNWYSSLSSYLLPIPSEVMSKEDFKKAFYSVAQKDLIKDGAIIGIPLDMDVLSLFVNPDILIKQGILPPTNWNDFITAARGVTLKDTNGNIKNGGAGFGTYDNVAHAADIISLLMAQDGVDLNSLSPREKVADALNFYTAFATPDGNVWDASLEDDESAFAKGNLGMFFGYYWDYIDIKKTNPSLKFGLNEVPQLGFPNIEIASYYPLGVSVKSKHQKETLAFLKFLSRSDIQNKIYVEEAKIRTYGEPPARKDLRPNVENTPMSKFVLNADNSVSSYFSSGTPQSGATDSNLDSSLSDAIKSVLSGTSAQTAADTLISSFSQAFSTPQSK